MFDERVLVSTLRLLHPLALSRFEAEVCSNELHAFKIFQYLHQFKLNNRATDAEITWERSLAQRIISLYETRVHSLTREAAFDASSPFFRRRKGSVTYLNLVKEDNGSLNAAAYRAAIASFEQVLELLRQPDAYPHFNGEEPTKSLCREVLRSFVSFLQPYSEGNRWSFFRLKIVIEVAAYIAEDIISSDVSQRYLIEGTKQCEFFVRYLFANTLSVEHTVLANSGASDYDASHMNDTKLGADDDLVGLEDDLLNIKEQLTGLPSKLKLIPIVGMGGIGKTTLARKIYEDSLIVYHFYVRSWITVSREYKRRSVLLGLLSSLTSVTDEASKERDEQLAGRLYRILKCQRYLIVMDDVWSTKTWDDLKMLSPNDDNGSRIILTSRLAEVASYADPVNPPHCMKFLGIQDSWRLLCIKMFANGICPYELVDIGMEISEKCQGLPLAIIVVAGHLCKIRKTRTDWNNVAKRVGSDMKGTYEQLFNILSVSYNYLPQQLKACFLYLGAFPRNSEIPARKLIKLWIAAGLLQTNCPNSLEKEAEQCLEDLIGRSLVTVRQTKSNGRVKTCGIHDLFWDLILGEVQKEGELVYGMHGLGLNSYLSYSDERAELMHLTFSLLYFGQDFESLLHHGSIHFKLLRVLDIAFQSFSYFPIEITQLVNLRYPALATSSNLPGSVSKLLNLETLINRHAFAGPILPVEIWQMPRLRHVDVGTCSYLPDPPSASIDGNIVVPTLSYLQTLSTVSSASCSKEVFSSIPNLKELKVHEIGEHSNIDVMLLNCLNNLVHLHQLEKLNLYCSVEIEGPRQIPQLKIFPPYLKQLTLKGSHLPWKVMNTLAKLPNLEVLKLKKNAFKGPIWKQSFEGFPQLKFLLLQSLDLEHWEANSSHFPNLQQLVLKNCIFLKEVPNSIGDIYTLQLIELENCSFTAIISAKEIQKEQRSLGNDDFNIRIGETLHELKLVIFTWAFIHMALILKDQWSEQSQC